jgi:PKD repeat protein
MHIFNDKFTYRLQNFYSFLWVTIFALPLACTDESTDSSDTNFDVVIIASTQQANAPARIQFASRSNGPLDGNYIYVWNFGDETGSEDAEPEHVFTNAGTYTVTLDVTEVDLGTFAQNTMDIEVLESVDLVATDVSFAPMVTLQSGDEVSLTWQVQQSGGVALENWRTQTFLVKAQEDGNAPTITATQWNNVNGKVDLVPFVEANNEVGTRYLEQQVIIPNGLISGDYYFGVYADLEGLLQEAVSDDNIALSSIAVRIRNQSDTGPDLSSCGLEILSFENTEVGQRPLIPLGEQMNIELCFSNLGDRPVLEVPYKLYLSADNQIDANDLLVDIATESALGINERKRKEISIDLPLELTPQTYRLILQVDPEDIIEEQKEDNNQRLGSIAFDVVEPGEVEGVDLVMGAVNFEQDKVYWGQRLTGSFILSHRGTVDVSRFFVVRFHALSTDGMTRIALPSVNLQGLMAGSDLNQEFSLNITQQIPVGEYRIEVEVDPTNSTNDVNGGNNSRTSSQIIELGGNAIFDPSVQSVSLGNTRVDAGNELLVNAQIKNIGETETSDFMVAFYLSDNEIIDEDDLILATREVNSLEGSEVFDIEEMLAIPIDLDQQVNPWYIALYIDPMQSLSGEASIDNNIGFAIDSLIIEGATGGCSEDEYEDNNVITNAIPLSNEQYNNLGLCDESDWFSTEVDDGEVLKLDLRWTANDPMDNVAPELILANLDGSVLRTAEWKGDALSLWVSAVELGMNRRARYQISGSNTHFQYDLNVVLEPANAAAQLRMSQLDVLPSIAEAGAPLQLSWVISNFGLADENAQNIHLYLFESLVGNAMPITTLDTVVSSSIAAESAVSMTHRTQLPANLADGLYYVVASLDMGLGMNRESWASAPIRIDEAQACTADQFEPNGSPHEQNGVNQQAESIMPGVYDQLYTCVGDDDWYRITLAAGEALNASITFTHSAGDLELALYDSDAQTLITDSTGLQNQESVELFRSTDGGDYLLRVYLGSTDQLNIANSYQLELEVGPSQSCGDDGYEPNASAEEAALISDGLHELLICPGGADWFRFNIPAGNTVSYNLNAGAGAIELSLFDPDNRLLESNSQRITYEAAITGTYLLRARSLNQNEPTAYALEISGVSGVDLAIEEIILTSNEAGVQDELLARVDISNLRGDSVENVMVAFTLSDDLRATDDDLLLSMRTIDEIQGAAQISVRERLRIPAQALIGPQYLLVEIDPNRILPDIRPSNNVRTQEFTVLPACVDDDDRSNEGASTATDLTTLMSSYEAIICPYTEDWYTWNAEMGARQVTFESTQALDVRVYHAQDQSVIAERFDISGTEVIEFNLEMAGDVLIQVDGFFDAQATYTLSWQ